MENTYQTVFEAIQKRAAQFAEAGIVGYGDKVVLYKSPAFDTYLLAVAVTALGAVPVMISYHLPSSNLDVFAERLEKSLIVYDQETEERVAGVTRTDLVTKVFLPHVLVQETVAFEENLLPEDVIQYMTHTSGTTGVPKLICHTAQTMGWRVAWQQTIFDKMTERGLLAFHISPVHSRYNIGVSSAIGLGFPLYPLSSARKDDVERAPALHRPSALETHPIFMQVYGQSECGPMILRYHRLENLETVSGRDMGIGLEGYTEARITDAQGNPLPAGENGHIQFL